MNRWVIPLALLVLFGACEPCTGLGSCEAPLVRYEGVAKRGVGTGRPSVPAPGVPVRFVATGEIGLADDTLFAETDADGRFILQGRAEEEGEVVGDLIFLPPTPIAPVRVPGVAMRTTRASGDLHRLGEWKIPFPYLGYQFRVFYRADGKPARGVEVEFRRTGGIGIDPDTVRLKVDPRGFVILRPEIEAQGIVNGDLTVFPLPPHQPFTVRGLAMRTVAEERFDSIFEIGIGQRLPYTSILVWEDTGKPVAGARVEFRRTGGVPIFPETYVATSDEFGTVQLTPVPLAAGEVVGEVVITPPAPGLRTTLAGVRLTTVEDQRAPLLLGYWGVRVGPRGSATHGVPGESGAAVEVVR